MTDDTFNWYRATPEERIEFQRGDWLKVKTHWWYEESTGKMQVQLIADLPKGVVFEVEREGKTREYRDGYIVFETGTLRGSPGQHLNYIQQMAVEGRIKLPQDRDSKQPYGSPGDGPEIDVRIEDAKRTIQSKTRLFPDDPKHEAWIASKAKESGLGGVHADAAKSRGDKAPKK
ncbi:MAG: hypothetical protein EB060_08775 [Proteobacteria bacterium]|nr:hypothetical protein [Pseudomonadota bacterium]